MRAAFLALPLSLLASPALAQSPSQPPIQLPPEVMEMRWADKLADMTATLSKVFLEMPVGEIEAAMEGREPTRADKRRTIRSETRMSEHDVRRSIEAAKPAMQAGVRAMNAALPSIMKGLEDARREMERVSANVPRPDYPKR